MAYTASLPSLLAQNLGTSEERGHADSQQSVEREALSRQEEVRDRCLGSEQCHHRAMPILSYTVCRTFGSGGIVAISQWSAAEAGFYHVAQSRDECLCQGNALVGFPFLESTVFFSALSHFGVAPLGHLFPWHGGDDVHIAGVRRTFFRHTATYQDARHWFVVLVVSPHVPLLQGKFYLFLSKYP